jgi:hypothetical protein
MSEILIVSLQQAEMKASFSEISMTIIKPNFQVNLFAFSFEMALLTPLSCVWAGFFAFAAFQRITPKQIAIITMMILKMISDAI